MRANSPCLHVYVLELAPAKTIDLITLYKSGSIGNIDCRHRTFASCFGAPMNDNNGGMVTMTAVEWPIQIRGVNRISEIGALMTVTWKN